MSSRNKSVISFHHCYVTYSNGESLRNALLDVDRARAELERLVSRQGLPSHHLVAAVGYSSDQEEVEPHFPITTTPESKKRGNERSDCQEEESEERSKKRQKISSDS